MSGSDLGSASDVESDVDSGPNDLDIDVLLPVDDTPGQDLEGSDRGNHAGALGEEKKETTFQKAFREFKEKHLYFDYGWAVGVDAAPLFGTMLASLIADSIIQHFMNNLDVEPGASIYLAAACQWVGTYKLVQTAMAQPTSALFSVLSKARGKAAKAVRAGDDVAKNKALQKYFRLTQQGIIYSLWSSLLVSGAFYWSGSILQSQPFNENPNITDIVQKFLRWGIIGVPAFSYSAALRPYLLIFEKRNVVNWVNFLSLPLVFLLSYGFATGNLAPVLPQLGLEGLAIAMAARSWLMAIVCSGYILRGSANPIVEVKKDEHSKEFESIALGSIKLSQVFHFKRENFFESMRQFLKTGLPLIGKLGVESATTISCAKWLGNIGPAALAVDSVGTATSNIVFLPAQAFSNAASQKVGTARGFGDRQLASCYGHTAVIVSATWAALWLGIMYPASRFFAGIFLSSEDRDDPQVSDWLQRMMVLGMASQLFDSIRTASAGAYQGLTQNTIRVMILSLVGMIIIGLPVSYGLGLHTSLAPYGVYLGSVAGDFIAGVSCLWLWLRAAKFKNSDVPSEPSNARNNTRDGSVGSGYSAMTVGKPVSHLKPVRKIPNQSPAAANNPAASLLVASTVSNVSYVSDGQNFADASSSSLGSRSSSPWHGAHVGILNTVQPAVAAAPHRPVGGSPVDTDVQPPV